jgi:hypothetical protein
MAHWKRGMIVAAAGGLLAAAPASTNLSSLSVLRDVKPGMWSHSFTTIPKNPAVPDQAEQACVSAAQLAAMLRESLATGPNEEQCPITIDSDAMTKAQFTMHCPAITIEALGISAPGADIPGTIERSPGQDHWVASVRTPAVPGVTPAAVWRHEYRRLGACPG